MVDSLMEIYDVIFVYFLSELSKYFKVDCHILVCRHAQKPSLTCGISML